MEHPTNQPGAINLKNNAANQLTFSIIFATGDTRVVRYWRSIANRLHWTERAGRCFRKACNRLAIMIGHSPAATLELRSAWIVRGAESGKGFHFEVRTEVKTEETALREFLIDELNREFVQNLKF